jgi:hypothetical protein
MADQQPQPGTKEFWDWVKKNGVPKPTPSINT